jgi:hypothetical protein
MSKPATHILIEFESKDMTLLYRASDGMSLGCRTGINVVFGESRDPARLLARGFLDAIHARAYLRHCADLDVNHIAPSDERQSFGPGETLQLEFAASFDNREGETRIVSPSNSLRN